MHHETVCYLNATKYVELKNVKLSISIEFTDCKVCKPHFFSKVDLSCLNMANMIYDCNGGVV